MEEKAEKKFSWKRELLEWLNAFIFAAVITFLMFNYVCRMVRVEGPSMQPTLIQDNRLFVYKLLYTPKRHDIIIFTPETDPKRPYVKRVIAVAGDTIYIDFDSGDVFINDVVQDEPYINDRTRNKGAYVSNLPNFSRENPIVIEEGFVWAMGDNRNNSLDSRALGPIEVNRIMGRALVRLWPLNEIGKL